MINWHLHTFFKKLYLSLTSIKYIFRLFASIMKIFIYSRGEKIDHENNNSAIFVGNSKDKIDVNKINKKLRAVSNFLIMDKSYFDLINPTHYFIIDPLFYTSNNDRFNKFWLRINDLDNPIKIVVPSLYYKTAIKLINNPLIKINSICLTPIDGPKNIIYFFTKLGLGTYKVKNVLGAFLIFCYKQNISNVDLYGVNHDWSRFMYLNNDLDLCLSSQSHKNRLISSGTLWRKNASEIWRVSEAYKSLYEAFMFYDFYEDLFNKNNVDIKIHSKDSLIQNFKRI